MLTELMNRYRINHTSDVYYRNIEFSIENTLKDVIRMSCQDYGAILKFKTEKKTEDIIALFHDIKKQERLLKLCNYMLPFFNQGD